MSEELRDRIESVIADEADCDGYGGYSARRQAQAIIDEFELQVVEVDRIDLNDRTVASYQVVGKWEKQ